VADSLKLSRGVSKPLLVDAARDLLPDEVWNRPKQGFVLPFADWMRGPLAAEVKATLGDEGRLNSIGIDPDAAQGVWSAFVARQPGVTWSRPWALYSLVRWATEHGVDGAGVTDSATPEALAL
jgi:asparagine synthase (glutamine-hydrolysing)